MHPMVVMVAQGHKIGEIRQSLVGPVHDVMDVGEDVVGASWEATTSITSLHLVTLRLGGETLGAALEHRVAESIIERQCDVGLATDAPNGLTTEQTHAARSPPDRCHLAGVTGPCGRSRGSSIWIWTRPRAADQRRVATRGHRCHQIQNSPRRLPASSDAGVPAFDRYQRGHRLDVGRSGSRRRRGRDALAP